MLDSKKEWMSKADIDYFAPFISLWLACNAWYNSHYSDITGSDRDFINKLKSDFTGRNQLFGKFNRLIIGTDKDSINFRTNLELLHYSLVRANLKPERIDACSLEKAIIDYSTKTEKNLIRNIKLTRNEKIRNKDKINVIQLDRIFITSNLEEFFAGLFEIIYQVRNMLIHGQLKPGKDEHETVKYCYMILWQLMN